MSQPASSAFTRVLVANRGEVALRIVRAARALGLETVAVHTIEDAGSPHVRAADRVVSLASPRGYLDARALINAALSVQAQAVHPGYGFLAENADFAQACVDAGLRFIGPAPAAIRRMGDKSAARVAMAAAGLDVIPGYDGGDQGDSRLREEARRIGFPLMIKACAGGGGRGMRRVNRVDDFDSALASARAEAFAAFGNDSVLLERAVDGARHVEIQIVADSAGEVMHLGERDCSVQRRHQKLIEEAPSPAVDAGRRALIGQRVVEAVRTLGYEGVGTVEFLLSPDGAFLFMEMNTRLQVEHPVTECVYGIDLVEWQFRIAQGARLGDLLKPFAGSLSGDGRGGGRWLPSGHAIEVRLCAEDPSNGFLPQSGRIERWAIPEGVRVEHALVDGALVLPDYDSMIARLIVHATDRDAALRRLIQALAGLQVFGLTTNRDFLIRCLRHPVFAEGLADTGFISRHADALLRPDEPHARRLIAIAAGLLCAASDELTDAVLLPRLPRPIRLALGDEVIRYRVERQSAGVFNVYEAHASQSIRFERIHPDDTRVSVDGVPVRLCWWREGALIGLGSDDLTLHLHDLSFQPEAPRRQPAPLGPSGVSGQLAAPMQGRVSCLAAAPGDMVEEGALLMTLEAMKIEHRICAPFTGSVAQVAVKAGVLVQRGAPLITIEPSASD